MVGDIRGIKRPRSSTPTPPVGVPSKKKIKNASVSFAKDGNNPKRRSRSASESTSATAENRGEGATSGSTRSAGSSREHSTATQEGRMMAQMLSTFTKLELSRFEAFRRATFSQSAISQWLAAILAYRHAAADVNAKRRRAKLLSEFVLPGQDDTISMVGVVLAKIYAQRLVSTAVQLQRQEVADNNGTAVERSIEPLSPTDVLAALEHRQSLGLDPGFFLQPAPSFCAAQKFSTTDRLHDKKRVVALALQEEYDQRSEETFSVAADDNNASISPANADDKITAQVKADKSAQDNMEL